MWKLFTKKASDGDNLDGDIKNNDTIKAVEADVEVLDPYDILHSLHTKRLGVLEVGDALAESSTEELRDALFGVLSHAQQLTRELGWALRNIPHMPSVTYGNAVTCILADILHNAPSYLSWAGTDDARLAKCLAEYFSFMGVLHDHLSDSEIDEEVKLTISRYYETYVDTSFSV